ncbi:helix-turn-helix domain-containing protein [Thermostaphylospora chromogena]|uniref:DNA binding domain-containing protein, excisionase family n=1 Tax=Thermostaphylospora chromogena TaxID=35622 RepID=A0A1H1FX77_9ACTN|nr:helix-turn-helix domain-containing protein [Thermostaphylospora chromogena]SDR05593.1 DNA binding domain-containing protein, excisionase family [Thermostaphylospora chromogena]
MTRRLLRVDEAAEALAISRAKLYQLMASGAISYVRIGRSRRIPVVAIEAFIAALVDKEDAA